MANTLRPAASGLILLAVWVSTGTSIAGPFTVPPNAPPLATPLPPGVPAVGSTFDAPMLVNESVAAPVSSVWEVDIGRTGPGAWIVQPDPVVVQDAIGVDHVHFRIALNFTPPIGALPPWNVYVVMGANPWNFAPPIAFRLSSIDPFFMSPPIPSIPNFPSGSYAFNVVLTDSSNTVLDALDPLLIVDADFQAPAEPVTLTDHFLCYDLKGGARQERTVALKDQFWDGQYAVLRPVRLCTPASKNGEKILFPTVHLTCYSVRKARGPKRLPKGSVIVESQFGTDRLEARRPKELCLPTFKIPTGNPMGKRPERPPAHKEGGQ